MIKALTAIALLLALGAVALAKHSGRTNKPRASER